MNRTAFSSNLPFSPEEIGKALSNALPGADRARSAGLAQLATVRDAKARSLSREQVVLARKHGTDAHPRIAEARQRFATNEALRREIAVASEIAETPLPKPDAATLVIHGFVRRRRDHAGLPGLTLALTDEQGNWLREPGYACTDRRGYFRLDVNLRESGENYDRAPRLTVFDAKGNTVHTEARAVTLKPGAVDYRYILLGDEDAECACTPPPAKAGGRPATTGPKAPAETQPPTSRPKDAPAGPSTSRVADLKHYEQPARQDLARSQPVEAVRGIGPKTGEKLRRAGIDDVAELSETKGADLVKLAGFDKKAPKPKPATKAKSSTEKAAEKKRADQAPSSRKPKS